MRSRLIFAAVAAALAASLGLSACEELNASQDSHYESQGDACETCRGALVDCTSRSTTDVEFVACRDSYLGCQQDGGLSVGKCTNPDDSSACVLCRSRYDQCSQAVSGDPCESQFDRCKEQLLRNEEARGQCGTLVEPPADPDGCVLCKNNYARCMSDASGVNTVQICGVLFMECGLTVGLPVDACPLPSAEEACGLCITEHDTCVAAGGDADPQADNCSANFLACSTKLASEVVCELSFDAGEGGSDGAGGAGGGGGAAAVDCNHDTCEIGPALESSCDACATSVCDVDAYCCTAEWDAKCVEWATKLKGCECEA
jgi:hypothetical protein